MVLPRFQRVIVFISINSRSDLKKKKTSKVDLIDISIHAWKTCKAAQSLRESVYRSFKHGKSKQSLLNSSHKQQNVHRSIKVLAVHLKGKLKLQLIKDLHEMAAVHVVEVCYKMTRLVSSRPCGTFLNIF